MDSPYGWTPEQAIGLEPPPKRKGNLKGSAIEVQGFKYPSIKAAAIKYGLEPATAVARLNKFNWTTEQAFDLAPRPPSAGVKRGHFVMVGGVEYSSWAKAAKAHGLSIQVVKWRIAEGWSIDEAFGLIERKKQRPPRSVVFQGITYPSISAACRDLGLNRGAVGQHMLRGKSPEEALAAVKG